MSKSTTIECPTCAGQGVYCDDCLSTGSITVVGPVAVFVEELHSQLAAATARAEAAEADAIHWVPVSECLPPTGRRVLAAYNDGRATMTIRTLHIPPHTVLCYGDYEEPEWDEESDASYFPGGWYEAVEDGEYAFIGPLSGTVTHWAQLPKLPEVQP